MTHLQGEVGVPAQPMRAKKISWIIWLVPLIALAITAWLGWDAWENRGINITVIFADGAGVVADRTVVRYNGLEVGIVKSTHLQNDLKGVVTTLNMNKEFKEWLAQGTQFWLVCPEISLAGVSGLETLLSGNYITLNPEHGPLQTSFQALAEPPPSKGKKDGLHIELEAEDAESLLVGSPVLSLGFTVGEIEQINLDTNNRGVKVLIYIKPEYAHLVKAHSYFWNVSGLNISASLSQLNVHMDSLLSLIKGGIAFASPDWEKDGKPAKDYSRFKLFKSYADVETGIPIEIQFPLSDEVIQVGSHLMFYGIKVGTVQSYKISDDLETFVVQAQVNPMAEPLLVKGLRLWLVETTITAQGVKGLDALFSGPYIAMNITQSAIKRGEKTRQFVGYSSEPPASLDAPGLHLRFYTQEAGGLTHGTGVWMKGLEIGRVESVRLKDNQIEGRILINAKYQLMIRENTRCWNGSGLSFGGNMNGIHIQSKPLAAILSGGIVCETPDQQGQPVYNNHHLPLYGSREEAFDNGKTFFLLATRAPSLSTGSPIYYSGVEVGKVIAVDLAKVANHVMVKVRINSKYEPLVTTASRFWDVSGIQADFSLWDGLTLQTESLSAILRGGIAFATPTIAKPAPKGMSFTLHPEAKQEWLRWRPPIVLNKP